MKHHKTIVMLQIKSQTEFSWLKIMKNVTNSTLTSILGFRVKIFNVFLLQFQYIRTVYFFINFLSLIGYKLVCSGGRGRVDF